MESDPLSYYRRQGPMTDPREETALFEPLPHDIPKLREVVQGLVIHVFWVSRYGVTIPQSRNRELQMRTVPEKLKQIRELDPHPITRTRPPERRLLGNCRDFSILLCSMLRRQEIPARARCGFATYFMPNHFEDHWVCEYWEKSGRWVMVDAQLDTLQRERLNIDFDPLDVPADRFIVGGKAWQMCRSGESDPDAFGINNLHGPWFVRGNLIRDLASLNKVELLPWDAWGLIEREEGSVSATDLSLLDRTATVSQQNNKRFADLRALYLDSDLLRVPPVITSYVNSIPQRVEISRNLDLQ